MICPCYLQEIKRAMINYDVHQRVLEEKGNVVHCAICGDTQDKCPLKRCINNVLCDDCIRIQLEVLQPQVLDSMNDDHLEPHHAG